MNFFALLFFAYYAVIFIIVAVPFLLAVSWAINKWVLKRRIRLVYRVLISFGVPILLVGLAFLDMYYAPYSTKGMDEKLSALVPEIKLPPYKITEYSSVYVGGDDLKDTYQIKFKSGKDERLRQVLDSLIACNPKWKSVAGGYVYDTTFWGKEIVDSIIIRPTEGSATFIEYKW